MVRVSEEQVETKPVAWAVDIVERCLEEHQRVGAACQCGWTQAPMLDRAHRHHQAEAIIVMVLASVSQVQGANLAAARHNDASRIEALERQLDECRTHVMKG